MNTIWLFLNGKKSVIAAVLGTVLAWAHARGLVDSDTSFMLASVLTIITGVAAGHKGYKAVTHKE